MKKKSENTLYEGNWLTLKEKVFETETGHIINWEMVQRKNKNISLIMIPKLVPSNRYLIIKQYRPSIENHVYGFPAGISEGDDIDEQILKELDEETGYKGRIVEKSPLLRTNSGLMDDYAIIAHLEIDENDPKNKSVKQKLEPSEEIEVVKIEQDKMKEFLLSEMGRGIDIGMGLWHLCSSL